MKKLLILLLSLTYFQARAQIKVPIKIDTTQQKTQHLYQFIKSYMQKDTISNQLWHPKYKAKTGYDYTVDWIWKIYAPKKITTLFDVELAELQQINDTLSYFKILVKTKPGKKDAFSGVYKYYIVKRDGKFYLDNCKVYDSGRFKKYITRNLHFYQSPFYHIDEEEMNKANRQLDTLYIQLQKPHLAKPIEYYMCSSEEELNNLSNIVLWDGGLGGFTNIPEGFVVAINNNPFYKHEFIHAILGMGANCFFLQEGIASLYGGMNKGTIGYAQGIKELQECYQKGDCNFENLYAREVKQQYNSSLTYTFAAAFCKYLISNYGLDFFYKLYYDKEITTNNFIEKVSQKTGKSPAQIKRAVEKLILPK